jgi:GAF domain-containing protein/ANTAR domain-containing protein
MIQDRLSDVLGELSRTLVVAYQIPNALERLCAQLTGMLPVSGCWAVVTDELDGELRFVAASDAVGRKLAALHGELGEGPCLEAVRRGEPVLVPDLDARDAVERFPRFAAKAVAGGVSAVYSFPLRNLDQQVGSVGLFNAAPAELDELDVELAQLLADLTTASIVGAHRYQQAGGLAADAQQRLADAAVLEQAKGRLSVQLGVPPDHALAHLQRYILASGGSLGEAAEQVTAGGLRLRRTADGTITRG